MNAKRFPAFPLNLSNPSNLATTMTPSTGNTTAVNKKPAIAVNVCSPAFYPKNGGKIKFPAPKNSENNIKLITTIFFLFNFISFSLQYTKKDSSQNMRRI